MRYTDSELFNVTEERWKAILDEAMTPRRFFEWCINRLQYLIKDSTKHDHWMSAESNHMRTYRMKSVDFYMEKIK